MPRIMEHVKHEYGIWPALDIPRGQISHYISPALKGATIHTW
jgi:hypothetical protein